jgi:FkbM family methyltransferase
MTIKARIYGAVEAISPPILFRLFKGSFMYRVIVRSLRAFSSNVTASQETVSTGVLAGAKLRLDARGAWQQAMLHDTYDVELFESLTKFPLTGKIVYDIGAHVGYHSLKFAALVGTTGHVYAFEPNPTNNERIEEHLALNPELARRITLCPCALSDTVGKTTFVSSADVDGGTSSGGFIDDASTLWAKRDYIEKTGFVTSTVTRNTIDALIDSGELTPPDLIKLDVEGAEQLVLAGGKNTLTEHHPHILIEFHSIFSTYDCMRQLAELGYKTSLLKHEDDGRVIVIAHHP